MIGIENLKELVLKNIEDTGYMNQVRAQLKLQVFKIIENQDAGQKKNSGFRWEHPLQTQLKGMDHGIKIQFIFEQGNNSLELMIEYLEFFKLDYTVQVLRKEANIQEPLIRESLAQRVGLQGKMDSMKPLLIILIGEYLKAINDASTPITKINPEKKKDQPIETKIIQKEKEPENQQTKSKSKEQSKETKEKEKPQTKAKQDDAKIGKNEQRPQTAVQPKKEPPTAVNKIRGATNNISNLYGFDMTGSGMQQSKSSYDDLMVGGNNSDPYAFNLDSKPVVRGNSQNADPYSFDLNKPGKSQNMYDFDMEEEYGKPNKQQKKGKIHQEIEEDIDDFVESKDDKKQSNNMFTSSEDMMRATQSMGVDESVDSLALEDYDYYEDVTKKR